MEILVPQLEKPGLIGVLTKEKAVNLKKKVKLIRYSIHLINFPVLSSMFINILQTSKRKPKKLRRKAQSQATKTLNKPKRGRVKKGKPKKAIKINGLDLLHSQTLLSTSPQGKLESYLKCFFLY